MGRLTPDAWLEGTTLQTKEIEVPELGGSILIRELPGEFATSAFIEVQNPGTAQMRQKIDYEALERRQFGLSVIKDDNTPQFTDDQVKEIASKHGRAYRRVIEAIDKLSALDKEGVEQTAARFPASRAGAAGANGSDGPGTRDAGPDRAVRVGAEVGQDSD